jgi:hypothetical protein
MAFPKKFSQQSSSEHIPQAFKISPYNIRHDNLDSIQNVRGRKVNIWEVIVSGILSIYIYIYICAPFRTVFEIELFHCTIPKLLIRKRYYELFVMPVFIVQVTKLVQFTQHNTATCISSARLAKRVPQSYGVNKSKRPLLDNVFFTTELKHFSAYNAYIHKRNGTV